MASEFVHVKEENHVSTVTIDRQSKLNALSPEVLNELGQAFAALNQSSAVRCVILQGAGDKAFVAGADIEQMSSMTAEQGRQYCELGHRTLDMIEQFRAPVIAQVQGFALGGGCELALACDFIVAADKAKFGQPEVKLGIMAGFGGTQRLARRVGPAWARELLYTAAVIDAQEALRIGLVNHVFPIAELAARTRAMADSIVAMGPMAVAYSKRAVMQGADRPLPEANAMEKELFVQCFASADRVEGTKAFLQKRAAQFQGK